MSERTYVTSDFDFHLPPEQVAQAPAERRDASRLLVVDRAAGSLSDRGFADLVDYVPTGDALVLNETRVFPARLLGRKATGAAAEVLLLNPYEGQEKVWTALVRPGGKLKPGRTVEVGPELSVQILESTPGGERIVRLDTPLGLTEALDRYGEIPLPPYVERAATEEDRERYQTVYARERGSVAAPTAGLHFTPALLRGLEAKGVRIVRLVLHVGVGTFRPVETEDPAEHRMHSERYAVSADAADALNATRAAGGAIWAVGTTVVRTLESVATDDGVVHAGEGWTDIFIRPPYPFKAVDHLVTNFHLPRSTLLMLVSAFGGYELVMRAYREAIHRGYRFYSYGDAMLLV
ncbi:tRNA preQ1(34) S-adenosylmethionine ribosyltransferase-isomerase QueA [Longimicrobium sp.]|uniref:tRNA preQ1(34) S-adenosylmethionine ribosyltransferase-isomerase QueA n=1 Tax=Longimicrobium sp. TaxID=2029185 RepID=UPI002E304156|nr:tRNA preQ1(34) S-adenosylmethionine ribosyltransferase-isomerase QueA [Longimicrobium sp.]HEX6036601.1 tRNA preQ1(34) S-adenosylmethionine ribosyltransferase-isomerase QueA [Longimicrobium sp.]